MASDLKKIGALWKKTGKSGNTFYSGRLEPEAVKSALAGGDTSILLFPVKEKRGKGPDVELFVAPQRDDRARPATTTQRASRVDDLDDFGELP